MDIIQTHEQSVLFKEGDIITYEAAGKLYDKMTINGIDTDANALIISSSATPGKPKAYPVTDLNFLLELDCSKLFDPEPEPEPCLLVRLV